MDNIGALPRWAWRQHATWQDDHISFYKKVAKEGLLCVNC